MTGEEKRGRGNGRNKAPPYFPQNCAEGTGESTAREQEEEILENTCVGTISKKGEEEGQVERRSGRGKGLFTRLVAPANVPPPRYVFPPSYYCKFSFLLASAAAATFSSVQPPELMRVWRSPTVKWKKSHRATAASSSLPRKEEDDDGEATPSFLFFLPPPLDSEGRSLPLCYNNSFRPAWQKVEGGEEDLPSLSLSPR